MKIFIERRGSLCWRLDTIEKLLVTYGVVIKSSKSEKILRKTYSILCEILPKLAMSLLEDEQIQRVLKIIVSDAFNEVMEARSYFMQMKAVQLIALPCMKNLRVDLGKNVQLAPRYKAVAAQFFEKLEAISSDDYQQVRHP